MGAARRFFRFAPRLAALLVLASAFAASAPAAPGERWRLEISAGIGWLAPADLNGFARSDRALQQFLYDAHLDYLRGQGALLSWQKEASGGPRDVRNVRPIGLRLRWRVRGALSLSAGMQYGRGGGAAAATVVYTRNMAGGERYVETLAWSPYELSATTWWPHIGVHLATRPGRGPGIEGFAAAGPLFARCAYRSEWRYSWNIQGAGYEWAVFRNAGRRQEAGTGTGLALEAGVRIATPLLRRLDLFVEGAYARQTVDSLSGSGFEERDGSRESWRGPWGTRSETLTTPWGTLAVAYPTGQQPVAGALGRFRLDLSGVRLRAGISLRL